ncbi:MAG: hypothetical protein AAB722_00800 [Patescibacteria group bacterium]
MDAEIITPIVLEFIRGRPVGQDLLEIRKHLGGPGFQETKKLMEDLVVQGLLSAHDRVVEGRRLATFYQITAKGLSCSKTASNLLVQTGLSKGRESHGARTRTKVGASR